MTIGPDLNTAAASLISSQEEAVTNSSPDEQERTHAENKQSPIERTKEIMENIGTTINSI